MFALVQHSLFRKIVIILFILPLMFAGGSLISGLTQQPVGSVGSLEVSRAEYENQRQRVAEGYRSQYGVDTIPAAWGEQIDLEARQNLVSEYLMRIATEEKEIRAPDDAVALRIREYEDFQDKDGNFSKALYDEYVTDPIRFHEQVRRLLNRESLLAAMDAFPIEKIRTRLATFRRQQRIIDEAVVSVTAVFDIPEEDINLYYQSRQSDYTLKEKADFEYLVLSLDEFAKESEISEEAVQAAYENYSAEKDDGERRRVRHIYIAGDTEEAKEKAQDIVRRTANEDFTALAKAESDDAGSALLGGDWGFVSFDDLPSDIEEAIFSLKIGEVSSPIIVDGGFSILKLEEIARPALPPLSTVRDEMERRARREQGHDDFDEKIAALSDIAYVQIGSLLSVAAAADVSLKVAKDIYSATPAANSSPFQSQDILAELFTPSLVENGESSAPIALDENTYIFARAQKYQAARTQDISEVRDEIEAILSAKLASEQWLENKTTGGDIDLPADIEWEKLRTVNLTGNEEEELGDDDEEQIIDEVFAADLSSGLPAYAMILEPNQVRIIRVRKVVNDTPLDKDFLVIDELLTPQQKGLAGAGYLDSLRHRYKVDFDKPDTASQ